jgi:hypothetical protein
MHGSVVWGTMPGPGVTLYGDFATGLNDDAKPNTGETPIYFGGRAELGLPMFSVWAGFGSYNPGGEGAEKSTPFGGGVGVNIIKGPMVPVMVTLEAGVGYLKESGAVEGDDNKRLDVPIGARVGINVPSAGIGIKPWITPRAHIVNWSVGGVEGSETKVGFGVNAGLAVQLMMGLGIEASVDWMSIKFVEGADAWKPLTLGVAAFYRISVPSLGVM